MGGVTDCLRSEGRCNGKHLDGAIDTPGMVWAWAWGEHGDGDGGGGEHINITWGCGISKAWEDGDGDEWEEGGMRGANWCDRLVRVSLLHTHPSMHEMLREEGREGGQRGFNATADAPCAFANSCRPSVMPARDSRQKAYLSSPEPDLSSCQPTSAGGVRTLI